MQNKPNFQNTKNALTLVDTRNYNELWDVDYYAKQTQSNPISIIAEQGFVLNIYPPQADLDFKILNLFRV